MKHWTRALWTFWVALASAAMPTHAVADAAANQLMQKVRDRPDGKDWLSEISLELREPNGTTRVRKAWSLKKQQGKDDAYAMYFMSPADVRGMSFLSINRDEQVAGEDDMWMHLPVTRQVRRVSANDKRGAFMGSQFSYYDIEKLKVTDFEQKIVGEEKINGRVMVKLERTPVSEAVIEKSGYSKTIVWVDPTIALVMRQHLYDERGVLKKIGSVQEVEKIDGIWTPVDIEMANQIDGRVTRLRYVTTKYDVGLPDSFFQSNQLSNGASFERLPSLR